MRSLSTRSESKNETRTPIIVTQCVAERPINLPPRPAIKAANSGLTAAPIKIKNQDSKGVVYFDSYRGQVVRSNLVQTLQVEGTVNGTRVTQVVKTKVDVVVTDVK